jgi:hypothetical protein
MQTSALTVFISHVTEDEPLASGLKDYLESIFLNASIFVSGRDLAGGEVWIEELRSTLAAATAVIGVMTPLSLKSPGCISNSEPASVTSGRYPSSPME